MATYQLFDFSTFNQKNPMPAESFDFFSSRDYPSFMVILTFSLGHLAIHGIKQLVTPLQVYYHLALRFHLILLVICYPLLVRQTQLMSELVTKLVKFRALAGTEHL